MPTPESDELVLGLPRTVVRLVPHNPQWPGLYKAAEADLKQCLGSRLVDIEHIGSTAIRGLEAKPIIDIMVGVVSLKLPPDFFTDLKHLGYEHRSADTVVGRIFFARGLESSRTHNLSVCEAGSSFWVGQIAFREALRADPILAQQYRSLKRQLAQQYPHDRFSYTEAKGPFIRAVMAGAQRGVR